MGDIRNTEVLQPPRATIPKRMPPVWQSYTVTDKGIIALDTYGRLFRMTSDYAIIQLPSPLEK